MYRPSLIFLDFETCLLSGEPSVETYRPDFRAISCAFAWIGKNGTVRTFFAKNERNIAKFLRHCKDIPMVCHNFTFEYSVLKCRFPGYEQYLQWDTARMAQMVDNGGREHYQPESIEPSLDDVLDELEGKKKSNGLSLQACASRLLGADSYQHKEKYHDLIRQRGGKKGKEGAFLHLLTDDELQAYNVEDVLVTMRLYEECVKRLGSIDPFKADHVLYTSSARLIADAKIRGIRVDRDRLFDHCCEKEVDLDKIASDFKERFRDEITAIESELTDKAKMLRKTLAGQERVKTVTFNTKSTKQLEKLFVGKLGISAKYKTDKGNPSFSKKFLSQWGEGGELLKGQKRALIELKQGQKLHEKSYLDDRWHHDLKATGTKTNRFCGAGGLNIQGLSRGCKGLMSTMIPDEGNVFVSIDLSAGEPTVTTHYSGDELYYAANFGLVGKRPYYKDEILMISDIYLMCASFSPIASDKMKEAFERDWNGKSFADQWLEDDEVIKGALKKEIRNLHKIWALGLSYSMGPQKLQLSAFENGYDLPLKITKDFFKAYWRAFGKVKALGDMLQAKYLRQGYLSTTFGYRLYPDKDYKCLNYFIQSTVSGIMHWLNWRFFQKQHEAKFITVIHDEVILEIPYNQVEEVRRIWEETVEELNTALGWTVKIRTGWKVGANLYEAK